MSGPGGLPLAGGARGRDGLEMDQLHLPLGPLLSGWPAGLLATCTLQGDVVTDVTTETLGWRSLDGACSELVRRVDAARQLLTLAGARGLAWDLQRVSDDVRRAPGTASAVQRLGRVHDRLARSRVLRWSLQGLGVISDADIRRWTWPQAWQGDTFTRLLRLVEPGVAASLGTGRMVSDDRVSADLEVVAAALPALVVGVELASARLVVASLWGHDLVPVDTPAAGESSR